MKAFRAMLKVEMKIAIRQLDSVIFGIMFPVLVIVVLGVIYGNKPAFEGADYSFLQQSAGAVASIGIIATGLMGLPLGISDNRDKKVLKRFKVTPVSPALFLSVNFIVAFSIAVTSAACVFLIATLFFSYAMTGSVVGFMLSYLLVTISIYAIGMVIASLCPNVKIANLVCTIVYFPMLFLSGATLPYEVMPKTMQKIMDFLPLTQGIKLLKSTSLGLAMDNMPIPIIVMVIIAITGFLVSIKSFKWE